MISPQLRKDRWFKNDDNIAELAKLLEHPIMQEALAVCRENMMPKPGDIASADELGDTQREKAAAAMYAMMGYNKFITDLCILAGSIPDVHQLSAPWAHVKQPELR